MSKAYEHMALKFIPSAPIIVEIQKGYLYSKHLVWLIQLSR